MKYFISDLIVGMKHFAEFADWIESNRDPDLGSRSRIPISALNLPHSPMMKPIGRLWRPKSHR